MLTVPHLDIASSEAGREEQMVAAREMIGTGTCTAARVICSEVRADVVRANICDYPLCGCHRVEGGGGMKYRVMIGKYLEDGKMWRAEMARYPTHKAACAELKKVRDVNGYKISWIEEIKSSTNKQKG